MPDAEYGKRLKKIRPNTGVWERSRLPKQDRLLLKTTLENFLKNYYFSKGAF